MLVSDETSFAPALVPTAFVDILAPDGTKNCVRALIDQGAQCSMINSEVAKSLKLITKPAYVAVTGVGGVTSSYAQGRAMFEIASRHNPEVRIDVDTSHLIGVLRQNGIILRAFYSPTTTPTNPGRSILFLALTSPQKSFSAIFANLQTTMLWRQSHRILR